MASLTSLPHDWTEIAASHATTQWVKRWLLDTLPQLQDCSLDVQEFAEAFAQELEARNLTTPAQQKNYRSNVVQALKSFDPTHPAITLVSPTTEQYRELNDAQRGKLADRETRYFTSDQAQQLVDRATDLLSSAEWSEVAAGLAVLMGRRISEILLSGFALKSHWSLSFSEMSKKQGTEGLTIEIPTLAPAQTVLTAIEKLQRNLKIEDLKAASLSPKMTKQKVNSRYSEAVASQCHTHFADLIPTRTDRENLYTHLFRAVYATIAAHWFCPTNIPEHNFKAEIQGHFSLAADGRKLPNFSARSNYDDYAIGSEDGNRDGRLGIKLGTLPGLQVIEVFRKPETAPEAQQPQEEGEPMDITTLSNEHRNALVYRAANLLSGTWAEMSIGLELLTGLRSDVLQAAEVETLAPFVLRVDGEEVETLVQQLEPTIVKFQQLQPDSGADEMTLEGVVDLTFASLGKLHRDDLPQVYAIILQSRRQKQEPQPEQQEPQQQQNPLAVSASAQTPEQPIAPPPTQTMPQPKPQIRRPPLYEADIDKLPALMLKRGITGTLAEVFHRAIELLESEQLQQQQQQTVGEVAQTMNWFTSRIEKLENTIEQLHQERQQWQAQAGETQATKQLQAEKEQLQQALQQTQSRLAAIDKLFGRETIERLLGTAHPVTVPVNKPAPVEANPIPQPVAPPIPSPKQQQSVKPQPRRNPNRRSREELAEESNRKVDAMIHAIISWNTSQNEPQQCIRISHKPLRALGRLIGANSQSRIEDGIKRHQEEIDQMNAQLGLGEFHNTQVKNKQALLQTIARENLGLENWQEVEWA